MVRRMLTFLLFATACAVIGFVIVCPLWKWATVSPASYSLAVIAFLASLLIFQLIKSFRAQGARVFFRRASSLILAAAGISLCVYFILHGGRLFAFLSLAGCTALYGLVNFALRKTN